MKVVLVGGSGQDAFYLATYLADNDCEVYWLYRSQLNLYQEYIQCKSIKCFRVYTYSFDEMSSCLSGIDYDCIILIAGAVGNRLARENSLQVYDTNSHILSEVCRLIVSSNSQPHLYYFSSCDIDGRTSSSPFVFSSTPLTAPVTSYGLSKRHSSELIKSLVSADILSGTIVHFGMHESFCRQGDYVLSKIKRLIRAKLKNETLNKITFGNLNVWLDIGFAPEFMQIFGNIVLKKYRPIEISIGTGQYTQLKTLCKSILEDYEISFDQYVILQSSSDQPIFYPLMPTSFCTQCALPGLETSFLSNAPSPLTVEMLKSEHYSFQVK